MPPLRQHVDEPVSGRPNLLKSNYSRLVKEEEERKKMQEASRRRHAEQEAMEKRHEGTPFYDPRFSTPPTDSTGSSSMGDIARRRWQSPLAPAALPRQMSLLCAAALEHMEVGSMIPVLPRAVWPERYRVIECTYAEEAAFVRFTPWERGGRSEDIHCL